MNFLWQGMRCRRGGGVFDGPAPKFTVSGSHGARSYHLQTFLSSYRTLMRPDIQHPRLLKLKKGTKEYDAQSQMMRDWWKGIHPDHLVKTLLNFADNRQFVRFGILIKLVEKAETALHIKAIYSLVMWLYVRWDKDLGDEYAGPIAKAIHRTRTPANGLRLLASPWIRIYPSAKALWPLLLMANDWAAESLYHIPYPNRFPAPPTIQEDLYAHIPPPAQRVNIYEDVVNENFPTPPVISFHPEVSDPKVVARRVFSYFNADYQTFKKTKKCYIMEADTWAMLGEVSRVKNTLNRMNRDCKDDNSVMITDYLIPTCHLARKDYQAVVDGAPERYSGLYARVLIAAHLALGNDDQAYEILKCQNFNNKVFLYTHMGDEDRIEQVRAMYGKLRGEGHSVDESVLEILDLLA